MSDNIFIWLFRVNVDNVWNIFAHNILLLHMLVSLGYRENIHAYMNDHPEDNNDLLTMIDTKVVKIFPPWTQQQQKNCEIIEFSSSIISLRTKFSRFNF